mgnify:CR=1 FL=1
MSTTKSRVCAAGRGSRGAALLLLAAAFALGSPAGALAADNVYTIANYPIEAQADNAVAAKEKALADGQQAAFRSLLKRLIPVTAYAQGKRLASVKGADLIEGVRVRAERNSPTEYIASFDFSFNPKGVRDLLRREGIPFTDDQAPMVTLVPVWRSAPAQPPREEAAWSNVWKGLDLQNSLTPIKLQAVAEGSDRYILNRYPITDEDQHEDSAAFAAEVETMVSSGIANADTPEEELHVLLKDRLANNSTTIEIIDFLTSEIRARVELLCPTDVVTSRDGWPLYWRCHRSDRGQFLSDLRRFAGNDHADFGTLLTPLVNGLRIRGPFHPTWANELPYVMLVDREGLLELVYAPATPDENLEDSDADRVGEGFEELRLEDLELPADRSLHASQ